MLLKKRDSPVFKLPYQFNISALSSLFQDLGLNQYFGCDGTVSLLSRKSGIEDPWKDGTTNGVIADSDDFYFSENDFKSMNPGLTGTCFEECYQKVSEISHSRLGRVRLFRRIPQSTSSLHADLDIRLHIPLEVSQDSFIIFPKDGIYHLPADGSLYLVDTLRPHLAVNASSSECRTHLVFNTYCGFKEKRGLESKIIEANQSLFKKLAKTGEALPSSHCTKKFFY